MKSQDVNQIAEALKLYADVQDANIHVMLVDHNEFLTLPKPSGRDLDTRGVWKKSA